MLNTTLRTTLPLAVLLLVAGCATTGNRPQAEAPAPADPKDMHFVTRDNEAITWDTLVEQARAADIIVLGEQHDDLLGHQFQTALVKAILETQPLAVCMEMLERDEQPLVDAYLADAISQETLVDTTDSKDWGAKGMWDDFYQPTIDAAKAAKAPVIAANAPRRLARLGRFEDFECLAAFLAAYPGQFVVPGPIEQEAYAERFKDTMRHHSAPAPSKPKNGKKKNSEMGGMPPLTEEKIESFFRAQQVWDATMADSVVKAQAAHGKAVLLIGQFHTDHNGGTLLRMKTAAPELHYLTVSVQKASETVLRDEDKDRADIVVYHPSAE